MTTQGFEPLLFTVHLEYKVFSSGAFNELDHSGWMVKCVKARELNTVIPSTLKCKGFQPDIYIYYIN